MLGAARADRGAGRQCVRRDDQSPGGVRAPLGERRRVGLGRGVLATSRRWAPSIARASSTAIFAPLLTGAAGRRRRGRARAARRAHAADGDPVRRAGAVRADHRRRRPGDVGPGGAARRRAAVEAPRRTRSTRAASTRAASDPTASSTSRSRSAREGYRAFKLKVGFGAARDVANLARDARGARRRRRRS